MGEEYGSEFDINKKLVGPQLRTSGEMKLWRD